MKPDYPDIETFERLIFKKSGTLGMLLKYSLNIMQSRQVGLLYGTDVSNVKYLPPEQWDRGVMHKFNGVGWDGFILKVFGRWVVRMKGLSPIRLYKKTASDDRVENDGVISYILRKHHQFYVQGVKILIIDIPIKVQMDSAQVYSEVSIVSYDGRQFQPVENLKMNTAIARQFKARNFVSAYVPDYGAIVFNTIKPDLLIQKCQQYVNESELKFRLDSLISAIEMASLAHLGGARGRQALNLIWRKEKRLRLTIQRLMQKEKQLDEQRHYLRAVGAVNEQQLNMEAQNIPDGVYAFMDMVGSATVRKNLSPKDYFFILNLCHQIAADNASRFSCRVDNFIGDGVFLQHASPFDMKTDGRL